MANEFLGTFTSSAQCDKCGGTDFYIANNSCRICCIEYQREYRAKYGRESRGIRKTRAEIQRANENNSSMTSMLARKWI